MFGSFEITSNRLYTPLRNPLHGVYNLIEVISSWTEQKLRSILKYFLEFLIYRWPSWPWSYGCWIYNYLCNQCLSSLMLWVRLPLKVRCTTLYDKACPWLAAGRWFSPGRRVSSTNKTDRHEITEIVLKVALNTI